MTKNFKSTEPGIPYFVTFTVVEWLNVFTKPEYLQIIWDSLQYCRKEKGLKLYGFVFMTNHLHLIICADAEDIKLWQIIRDFKKFTAQIITGMNPKANFGNIFRSKLRCIIPSAARDCSTYQFRYACGIGVSQ